MLYSLLISSWGSTIVYTYIQQSWPWWPHAKGLRIFAWLSSQSCPLATSHQWPKSSHCPSWFQVEAPLRPYSTPQLKIVPCIITPTIWPTLAGLLAKVAYGLGNFVLKGQGSFSQRSSSWSGPWATSRQKPNLLCARDWTFSLVPQLKLVSCIVTNNLSLTLPCHPGKSSHQCCHFMFRNRVTLCGLELKLPADVYHYQLLL